MEKIGQRCEVSNLFVGSNSNPELSINLEAVLDKIYLAIKNNINKNTEKEKGLGITVLKSGHMMPLHVDKGYGDEKTIGNEKTPSGFPTREISSIFYWNENYAGGEIVFPNQNKTIKPSSGMLILFASTSDFPHKVLPVKSGIRYVSTNFWYCKWD
jgi:hypothetical protein